MDQLENSEEKSPREANLLIKTIKSMIKKCWQLLEDWKTRNIC